MNPTPQNLPCVVTAHSEGLFLTTATFEQIEEREKRARHIDRIMPIVDNIWLVVMLLLAAVLIRASATAQTFNVSVWLLLPMLTVVTFGYLALKIRKFKKYDRAFNTSHHLVDISRIPAPRASWVPAIVNLAGSIHRGMTELSKGGVDLSTELEDPRPHLNEAISLLSQEWSAGDEDTMRQTWERLHRIHKTFAPLAPNLG